MKFNWGTGIFIFLIIFVALGITFIVFSLQFDTNLVHKDYYEKGLDYDQNIAIEKRSKQYQNDIKITDDGEFVKINFSEKLAPKIEECNVYFFRPSNRYQDYQKDYKPENGEVHIVRDSLFAGKYNVKVSWREGEEIFMVEKMFVEKKQ